MHSAPNIKGGDKNSTFITPLMRSFNPTLHQIIVTKLFIIVHLLMLPITGIHKYTNHIFPLPLTIRALLIC